jgi:hypothetical protein
MLLELAGFGDAWLDGNGGDGGGGSGGMRFERGDAGVGMVG